MGRYNKYRHYRKHYNPNRNFNPHHKRNRFKLFNWIELPFVLFSSLIILLLIYSIIAGGFAGFLLFPIGICLAIAGVMVKWFSPHNTGFILLYHTLALSGVFLLLLALMLYNMFAPLFSMF